MHRIFRFSLFALTLLGLTIWFLSSHPDPLSVNRISVESMKGMLHDRAALIAAKPELARLAETNCDSNWMLGIILHRMGDDPEGRTAWRRLADCTRAELNLDLLIIVDRKDEDLARKIVARFPTNINALFLLGEIVTPQNSEQAIELFSKVVFYDPSNGKAWCRLGSLYYTNNKPEESLQSFIKCCNEGDPGSNGCWNVGLILEKSGSPQKAIEYYRLSHWQPAQDRANELEKQLKP